MNEDRMKGVCLVCRAEFAWVRFKQGHKKCEPCEQEEFAKFNQPRNAMKAQAKINGWSILNTGDGIAAKHLGGSALEVCLSVDGDGELVIEVHQEGVDEPVFVANVRESTT
jgi:hypothetical protein